MRNRESAAAKQSRWDRIALKSRSLFLKTKSARMLKERLQKYRLVKGKPEGVGGSDSQTGIYRHLESPNAPTVATPSSSSSTPTSDAPHGHFSTLEEALGDLITSPLDSTSRFERDWQLVRVSVECCYSCWIYVLRLQLRWISERDNFQRGRGEGSWKKIEILFL